MEMALGAIPRLASHDAAAAAHGVSREASGLRSVTRYSSPTSSTGGERRVHGVLRTAPRAPALETLAGHHPAAVLAGRGTGVVSRPAAVVKVARFGWRCPRFHLLQWSGRSG